MLTLNQIKNVTFERAGMKGYKAAAVDEFIEEVIETLEQEIAKRQDLEAKIEILAEKLEEYRGDEDSLRAALLGAQRMSNEVIGEAKKKADIILNDATIKSEGMISRAQDKVISYQEELVRVKSEVTSFKNALLSLYRDHIELISQLPSEQPEVVEEKPEQEVLQSSEEAAASQAETEEVVSAPTYELDLNSEDISSSIE
ncbi:MAG: DivIVA domain-containing protein [Oscillospiraceae bacterium]|jgi:cell division initiation protein|nr:DivIVA domain-containing protein [Oscillospiraceae bacterium]